MHNIVMGRLSRLSIDAAVEMAQTQWGFEEQATGAMAQHWPKANGAQQAFLRRSIVADLKEKITVATAVESADRKWQEHVQLATIPDLVAAAATQAGVGEKVALQSMETTVKFKMASP